MEHENKEFGLFKADFDDPAPSESSDEELIFPSQLKSDEIKDPFGLEKDWVVNSDEDDPLENITIDSSKV